jgi:hypothetical protein
MLAILKPKYWRKPNSTQVNKDLHKAISVLFLSAYYYILWRDIFSAIFFDTITIMTSVILIWTSIRSYILLT